MADKPGSYGKPGRPSKKRKAAARAAHKGSSHMSSHKGGKSAPQKRKK